jgi:hypothetical protein
MGAALPYEFGSSATAFIAPLLHFRNHPKQPIRLTWCIGDLALVEVDFCPGRVAG